MLIELSKDVRNNHATKTCHLMILFSGACPIKQYVPNKPNPVGLKVYLLSNPSGIVCDLFVYEGKKKYPNDLKYFWECEGAVFLLTRTLVPDHILYCDRFFNTVRLAEELLNPFNWDIYEKRVT